MTSTISAFASPERKAAWEKATGLKAPPDPRIAPTPAPVAQPIPKVNLSSRTYEGAAPPKSLGGKMGYIGPVPTPSATSTAATTKAATGTVDPVAAGKENAATFMNIIGGLPTDVKNRYLSSFSDFLSMSPEAQSGYLNSLESIASEIVAPKIEQTAKRTAEDLQYNKDKIELQRSQLQGTLDTVLSQLDFNKNQDIAKENKAAAKAFQNVTNTAFVTGVAGSGVNSRRNALVREGLQQNVDDTNIQWNQNTQNATLKANQGFQTLDQEIARLNQLNTRDVTDLDQQKKTDEMSIFLSLLGSKLGQAGEQDASALIAGVNGKATQGTAGSALESFVAGGTDAERKGTYNQQQEAKRIAALKDSITAARQTEDQQVSDYLNLKNNQVALRALGRTADAAALQKAIDGLSGVVDSVWSRASSGISTADEKAAGLDKRFFAGMDLQNSPGIDMGQVLDKRLNSFYEQVGLLYRGVDAENRPKITKYLQDNADFLKKYLNS